MARDQLLHLITDSRERGLIQMLETMPDRFSFDVQQLDVADIIISEDVAVERKAKNDFISSLIDGRLFEQLIRLTDSYPNCILILEAFDDDVLDNTGVNIRAIYGAMTYIAFKMGVPIIPTRNLEETLIVIERIAYREQVEDVKPVLSRRAKKGMGMKERREYMIESLIDTGPKKSKSLIDRFTTPYNVLNAIRETEITFTKSGTPKGIEGPLKEISGFSWKYLMKNKELIFGEEEK